MPAATSTDVLPNLGRVSSRYSIVAATLLAEIRAGRFKVGALMPTEEQLQRRFGVSRHTIRAALRELKSAGLLSSHPGIGTVVRAATAVPTYTHTFEERSTDIEGVAWKTRLKLIRHREVEADARLAAELGGRPGEGWLAAEVLRVAPPMAEPLGLLHVYLRPEFGAVLADLDGLRSPFYARVEEIQGSRFAEVEQAISATSLVPAAAKLLGARSGSAALRIVRRYRDQRARIGLVGVGLYPEGRFSLNSRLRPGWGARAEADRTPGPAGIARRPPR